MSRKALVVSLLVFCTASLVAGRALSCTNILVTKGASRDGAVMIAHSGDGSLHFTFIHYPAADHAPGSAAVIYDFHGNDIIGSSIAQVPHTYRVVGFMNEHQVSIGETTTGGRDELINPDGLLEYYPLQILTLQRAGTAREAIGIIVDLCAQYGYRSSGETFSIADPDEVWLLELIGRGPGRKGINYVAMRVPDGYISCHANMSRIGEFPPDDPDSCLYNPDIVEFATKRGYYDPASGESFSFREAFHPATPFKLRYCATRVWSIFRRAAPSQDFPPDYHRGVRGARPYPLWIKPDEKLSARDVLGLMRDHYEGTPYDLTRGMDAGPFGNPYRWRGTTSDPDAIHAFEVDGRIYAWERPIATQRAGFVFVSQCRSWLPDPIGGVTWFTWDDPYTSPTMPFYCCLGGPPPSYVGGSNDAFSWDSAWWVYNFVSNFAYGRWSRMLPDVLGAQKEIEDELFALQPAVEKTALELHGSDPALMQRYLTDYCVWHAEAIVAGWKRLGERLIAKHNDGFVLDDRGEPRGVGYHEEWLRRVVREKGEALSVPRWEDR